MSVEDLANRPRQSLCILPSTPGKDSSCSRSFPDRCVDRKRRDLSVERSKRKCDQNRGCVGFIKQNKKRTRWRLNRRMLLSHRPLKRKQRDDISAKNDAYFCNFVAVKTNVVQILPALRAL